MSANFGERPGKPPDGGKQPPGFRAEPDGLSLNAAAEEEAEMAERPPVPPPFPGTAPASPEPGDREGPGGGGKPPRLRTVGSPEPPDEGPPPATMEEAELERYRVETDEIRARNEAARTRTASEDRNTNKRADAEVEGIKSDTKTTQHERYFFMGLTALGVLLTAISSVIAGLTGQPLFFTGSSVGLLATGGGLRRLSVLTSPRRRKACFLGGKHGDEGAKE